VTDLRAITNPVATSMGYALDLLRAAGERDLANKLAVVRARWSKVVEQHIEQTKAAAVAHAKEETARAERLLFSLELPIHTVVEKNSREHHLVRHKKHGDQRWAVGLKLQAELKCRRIHVPRPCRVHLVRIAPQFLDPGDGLPASLSRVRDGVADCLKVNDRHEHLVRYTYDQEKNGARFSVRIEILAEVG
jgi:hypothetical protein